MASHGVPGSWVTAPTKLPAGPQTWIWWHPSPSCALAACTRNTFSEVELSFGPSPKGAVPKVAVLQEQEPHRDNNILSGN